MRINILIDDEVLAAAMQAGAFATAKEAVEAGLLLLVRRAARQRILALRGMLAWDDGTENMKDRGYASQEGHAD
jgi:Arc/MetJ family transcription regulator